jgi:hypothetical protein
MSEQEIDIYEQTEHRVQGLIKSIQRGNDATTTSRFIFERIQALIELKQHSEWIATTSHVNEKPFGIKPTVTYHTCKYLKATHGSGSLTLKKTIHQETI